ncbi:unnamed protein product [Auanema sp. JU1783]|nr:unnamed protein product [Auanema sp. JU1783]
MSFVVPTKKIHKQFDLNPWFYSEGYQELMSFLKAINDAVIKVKTTDDIKCSTNVISIIELLETIEKWISEYPPEDMGSQRYGNKAFRKWHERLEQDAVKLVSELVLKNGNQEASIELAPYLCDAFGNATRIDYGTGHEISFIIFCICLHKLNVLTDEDRQATALRVFNKYVQVCRKLQVVYHMEPAGSRGVHALDDFQFVPFIWGSAQLIGNKRLIPDSYTNAETVEAQAHVSLFLEAIKYINQTKKGAFHEHSNQLWNISAVPGWEKVNSGMFKMYEAEVLKKFPVVQHILFGSLFSFDKREDAPVEPLVRT